MKKIELKLIGLSYSVTHAGSFVVVLSEVGGNRKIPIIVKASDALYIEMKMQKVKYSRPLVHDVIRNITETLGADIQEMVITNIVEGIPYSKVILSNMVDEFPIDCSIGDAIALAIAYKCPIFCSNEVINILGFEMNDDGTISDEQYERNHMDRDYSGGATLENLENMLQKALENEEFEIAAQLRDRINELKEK
jgi:bifunctional DNase/RNase